MYKRGCVGRGFNYLFDKRSFCWLCIELRVLEKANSRSEEEEEKEEWEEEEEGEEGIEEEEEIVARWIWVYIIRIDVPVL